MSNESQARIQKENQRKKDIFELDIPTFKAMTSTGIKAGEEPKEVQGMLDREEEYYHDGIHKEPRKTYNYFIVLPDKKGMFDRRVPIDPFTIKMVEHTDEEQDGELQPAPQTIDFSI